MIISGAIIVRAVVLAFIPSHDSSLASYVGKTVTLSGVVAGDIEYKKDDYRFRLDTEYGAVYIMLEQLPESLKRSDELTLCGTLQAGFGNYDGFLYRPTVTKIAHSSTPDFAVQLRDGFSQSVVEQIGNEEQSNLALSYLTGQKTLLTEEQKQKLRLVGLAHVVVASGYHLSVVVGLAKKYLGKISRFACVAGALLLLTVYISITGFTPSMARAGLMTVLSLWAWYYGRRFHPARLILYVMAISLLLDLNYVTNLAWQLSFASYAGIIFISPLLAKFLYGDKKPGYVAGLIIASISAQLLCLPFTLYYFGSFPLLALVANVLVTPAIPFAMLGTFLLGVTHFPPLVFITKQILAFQLAVIDYLAAIPWTSIDFGAENPLVFLSYIPILALLLLLRRATRYSYRPSYAKIYAC